MDDCCKGGDATNAGSEGEGVHDADTAGVLDSDGEATGRGVGGRVTGAVDEEGDGDTGTAGAILYE